MKQTSASSSSARLQNAFSCFPTGQSWAKKGLQRQDQRSGSTKYGKSGLIWEWIELRAVKTVLSCKDVLLQRPLPVVENCEHDPVHCFIHGFLRPQLRSWPFSHQHNFTIASDFPVRSQVKLAPCVRLSCRCGLAIDIQARYFVGSTSAGGIHVRHQVRVKDITVIPHHA